VYKRQQDKRDEVDPGFDGFTRQAVFVGRVRAVSWGLSGPQSAGAGVCRRAGGWVQPNITRRSAAYDLAGEDDIGARTGEGGGAGADLPGVHDLEGPSLSFWALKRSGCTFVQGTGLRIHAKLF